MLYKNRVYTIFSTCLNETTYHENNGNFIVRLLLTYSSTRFGDVLAEHVS